MKPFKIVITDASRPELWYADKLGQEFEVASGEIAPDGKLFWVRERAREIGAVYWRDCELAPQPAERNAAELAQLRRVAEAAEELDEQMTSVSFMDGNEPEWLRLRDELKAWKAGKHGNS